MADEYDEIDKRVADALEKLAEAATKYVEIQTKLADSQARMMNASAEMAEVSAAGMKEMQAQEAADRAAYSAAGPGIFGSDSFLNELAELDAEEQPPASQGDHTHFRFND
jgi:chromosome segregation ATPase